jgi:hypothetical protein
MPRKPRYDDAFHVELRRRVRACRERKKVEQ